MIRVVIADDEPLAREGIVQRLRDFDDLEVVAECTNGREALRRILELRPALALLDIEMPGLNGLELVTRIPGDFEIQIVFVTAYDRYAMAAFERAAVAYLLKPLRTDQLQTAIERVRRLVDRDEILIERDRLLAALRELSGNEGLTTEQAVSGRPGRDALYVTDRGSHWRIPYADIDYIEAAGDYMCVAAGGATHILRSTLGTLLSRLEPIGFLRIHRSTAVNGSRIRRFRSNGHGDGWIMLSDGTELRCSRSYRRAVKRYLAANID